MLTLILIGLLEGSHAMDLKIILQIVLMGLLSVLIQWLQCFAQVSIEYIIYVVERVLRNI